MPRIPTVESRAEITTRAPGARRPVVVARRVGEEITEAGKTLEGIGEMFSRVRDLEQFTKAKTEIGRRTLDVRNNAANTAINSIEDSDNIIKTSKEELRKIRDEVLPKISNPETRIKMGGAFDLSSLSILNSIKNDARKRWIKSEKESMIEHVDFLKKAYITVKDSTLKQITLDELKETINNHIELGVIDKTKGREFLKDTIEELPVLDAENMISEDPVLARALIGKDIIEIKDPQEKERLLKLAETTAERNKTEAKFNFNIKKNTEEQDAAEAIVSNNITSVSQIDELPRASEEFKEVAKKLVLSKEKIDAKTIAIENEKLARQFDSLGLDKDGNIEKGFEELERYRINLIKAHGEGFISKSKMLEKLSQVRGAYTEDLGEIVSTKFKQRRDIRGFWNTLLTTFTTFTPTLVRKERGVLEKIVEAELPEEAQAEAMNFLDDELTKVFEKGEIPEGKVSEVATDIFKKYIKTLYPEIAGMDDIPNSIYDSQRGFNNVNNSSFKGEAEWEYRDGKLIRIKK